MLDYGKSQTCTAGFFKVTFINSVKAFKNPLFISTAYTAAGILKCQYCFTGNYGYCNLNAAVFTIILDPVVNKVINNLAQNCRYSFYLSFTATDAYCDIFSGSLFLQQPVREDFKEEDLFENGKGFVRRFNIGEKSVILVGLGADAMTEEGYKWAREKFNSDKDASGILLVNNYLLEDMRKPDKIDERALDLEKNVVKACRGRGKKRNDGAEK